MSIIGFLPFFVNHFLPSNLPGRIRALNSYESGHKWEGMEFNLGFENSNQSEIRFEEIQIVFLMFYLWNGKMFKISKGLWQISPLWVIWYAFWPYLLHNYFLPIFQLRNIHWVDKRPSRYLSCDFGWDFSKKTRIPILPYSASWWYNPRESTAKSKFAILY